MAHECEPAHALPVEHALEVGEARSRDEAIVGDRFDFENRREHRRGLCTPSGRRVSDRIEARLRRIERRSKSRDLFDALAGERPIGVRPDPLGGIPGIRVPNQIQRAIRAALLGGGHGFRSSTSPETR